MRRAGPGSPPAATAGLGSAAHTRPQAAAGEQPRVGPGPASGRRCRPPAAEGGPPAAGTWREPSRHGPVGAAARGPGASTGVSLEGRAAAAAARSLPSRRSAGRARALPAMPTVPCGARSRGLNATRRTLPSLFRVLCDEVQKEFLKMLKVQVYSSL